jgi:uncharacterized protein YjiS (DUF1127 family)
LGTKDPVIEHHQGEGRRESARNFRWESTIESFRNVLEITSANPNNGQGCKWHWRDLWERAMSVMSLSGAVTYRVSGWSKLESLFGEWWHRIRSRYELASLSERDLADMGMTRIDALNEIEKAFWQR